MTFSFLFESSHPENCNFFLATVDVFKHVTGNEDDNKKIRKNCKKISKKFKKKIGKKFKNCKKTNLKNFEMFFEKFD